MPAMLHNTPTPPSAKSISSDFVPMPHRTDALVEFIAQDKSFKGIGPAKSRALGEFYGTGLLDALLGEYADVAKVLGSEDLAITAFSAAQLKAPEMDLIAFLEDEGVADQIPSYRVIRIARAWGSEGVAAIRQNPYLLASFLPFVRVDQIAQKMGFGVRCAERYCAAVEYVLLKNLDDQNTWLDRAKILKRVSATLKESVDVAAAALTAAYEHQSAIEWSDGAQPAGAAEMEAFCAKKFEVLANSSPATNLVARIPTFGEIDKALKDYEETRPFPLTAKQRSVAGKIFGRRLNVLAGYAGSGKTTVLRAVCYLAERFGRIPLIITLSGRAAQRAREATERKAMTIAAFIKQEIQMSPDTLLIVDEASMLDLVDTWRILRRLDDASLLLVGDPMQLPPIGFGLVFPTLVDSKYLDVTLLDKVQRQSAESGIPSIAEQIRFGKPPCLSVFSRVEEGVSFIECARDEAVEIIKSIGTSLNSAGIARDDIQVIAAEKKGLGHVHQINDFFHKLNERKGRRPFPGAELPDADQTRLGITSWLCEDDPIIWKNNDYDRELWNGSLGRIIKVVSPYKIEVQMDGREIVLTTHDLVNIDLAYAVTVHKSQGSQWDRVIVPMFPSTILDRSMIYTSITRAAKQVIILGNRSTFDEAVRRAPNSLLRITTLKRRLEMEFNQVV